jgi:hypothetical protein
VLDDADVAVTATRLRRRLRPLGVSVTNRRGQGLSLQEP